jgi:hypothetical protein
MLGTRGNKHTLRICNTLLLHSNSWTNAPLHNVQVVRVLLLSYILFCIIRSITHEFFFYLVLEESSIIVQKAHIRGAIKRY